MKYTAASALLFLIVKTSAPLSPEPNRLIHELSPYLRLHAHNPVNWYPWGEEALEKARSENKPIFLSIGYMACHWCHVMEEESFSNPTIASIMNRHFVNIKVDREEKPDLDSIYMTAVQMQTGRGGWPMSVFLTPELKPFLGGTYFPPEGGHGMPGFRELLKMVHEGWLENKSDIVRFADSLAEEIRRRMEFEPPLSASLDSDVLKQADASLREEYDSEWGGFGQAPKFPPPSKISFLFRRYLYTGKKDLLKIATHTLDTMAAGGLRDHLGGGFHRYSTDRQWLVPHFEKMLYDNALLLGVYLEGYQLTGRMDYQEVVREISDYLLREMHSPEGPFYASEDADSSAPEDGERQEGRFYLWTQEEIEEILGRDRAALFSAYYSVRAGGNFSSREDYHRGRNILHRSATVSNLATAFSLTPVSVRETVAQAARLLFEARRQRPPPPKDDKIITAWNGLVIGSLARAYQILEEPAYLNAASRAAAFILDSMRQGEMLFRIHRNGKVKQPGYLDDYAYLAAGLLDLYEASFQTRWLREAEAVAKAMLERFRDSRGGGLVYTEEEHTHLLAREKKFNDSALPSPNGVAASALLRLGKFFDRKRYTEAAEEILKATWSQIETYPPLYLGIIRAADRLFYPGKEIVLVGAIEDEGIRSFLRTLHHRYLPNRVLALLDPVGRDREFLETLPLLRGKRRLSGKATAYVCENYLCLKPVTDPKAFEEQLKNF